MEIPKNLDLNGMLSSDDIQKLTELLGNNSVLLDKNNKKSKKKGRMTPQAKNQLLNQLSSHQTIQQNQKPLKDMTEDEKKDYRAELKKRLHNKQNEFKQMRSNHNLLQKSLDAKVKKSTENMKKEDIAKALQNAIQVEQNKTPDETQVEETQAEKTQVDETLKNNLESVEKLEDFIN